MRQVKFPKITLTLAVRDGDKPVALTTQDLLMQVLNVFRDERGQPVGPTMEDLEMRIPLRRKISDAKGSILLEQSEWEMLCKAIKQHRWLWVHEDVLKVCHAVTEAEECEVEPREPSRAERRRAAKAKP